MSDRLLSKRVAVLATDGFEQAELEEPILALEREGADVCIVSPKEGTIQGVNHLEKGEEFDVDFSLENAHVYDFDALVIPGGLANPDALRTNKEAIDFVRGFAEAGKPISAICHAPWVLIEAGLVKGKKLTSWPAIQSDVRNAGGEWVDEEVVLDENLVTSRKPDDLEAFNAKTIELISAAH